MKKNLIVLLSICFLGSVNPVFSQVKASNKTAKTKVTAVTTTPREKETLIEIATPYGIMVAKLYNATPLHRDNFIKLIKQGFYDSLLFHRIINGFMIQGGDPQSKHADSIAMLGNGSAPGDRVPAEFKTNFFHKKGALAAARDENPQKASSNCQFYVVQGKRVDTAQLSSIEKNIKNNNPGFAYSPEQKEIYGRIGGTPFLDQNYTVFGEVISGLDILDKIASVQTRPGDRPVQNVWMRMKIINE